MATKGGGALLLSNQPLHFPLSHFQTEYLLQGQIPACLSACPLRGKEQQRGDVSGSPRCHSLFPLPTCLLPRRGERQGHMNRNESLEEMCAYGMTTTLLNVEPG